MNDDDVSLLVARHSQPSRRRELTNRLGRIHDLGARRTLTRSIRLHPHRPVASPLKLVASTSHPHQILSSTQPLKENLLWPDATSISPLSR